MMRKVRRTICLLTAMLCALGLYPVRAEAVELPITSRAALLMERSTGQVLFAQNEHEQLEPASVTKIMTLLLTMEAIDSGTIGYDDVVTVSAAAAGMGGSQVYLAEGEQITVEELLKSVCVASGNDAAVALAEKVAGVHELFVEQMNRRASELGMADTHFVNCTGLTAEGHVTSAHDIALMSRELLLHHPDIRRFTTIWMDTIRDGAFQLANTNKLIRFYGARPRQRRRYGGGRRVGGQLLRHPSHRPSADEEPPRQRLLHGAAVPPGGTALSGAGLSPRAAGLRGDAPRLTGAVPPAVNT